MKYAYQCIMTERKIDQRNSALPKITWRNQHLATKTHFKNKIHIVLFKALSAFSSNIEVLNSKTFAP